MAFIMFGTAVVLLFLRFGLFHTESDKDKKSILIITWVLLVIILGSRNGEINYGTDLNSYYRTFQRISYTTSLTEAFETDVYKEKGYAFLCYIISRIIKWPQIILYFHAALCCGITLRFIYKKSCDIYISILVFMSLGLLQFYLTGFRQSMAISLCIVAIEYAEQNKLIKFIVTVLIASLVHQTAIVFFAAYFLIHLPIKKNSFILDGLLIIFINVLTPYLIRIGNDYFEKDYQMRYEGNQFGGVINLIIELYVILYIFWYLYKKNTLEKCITDKQNRVELEQEQENIIDVRYLHILSLGFVLYLIRFQAQVFERMSLYYTVVVMVLIPQVMKDEHNNNKDKRIIRLLFCSGLFFLIYWRYKAIDYIPFWS